jgi:asparagine synthase (glutamine-hydrolysing)
VCGVVGIWSRRPQASLEHDVIVMRDKLAHRGPDAAGVFVDAEVGLALGHRRLSIVDLSVQGAQPMHSHDGALVLCFNGEIYNAPDLARRLGDECGSVFRGHSDTEVMLEAVRCWGIEAAVPEFAGMFAFALWDREQRRLSLVRDRFGKKPLYYFEHEACLVFGSELKALIAHPRFSSELDRGVLARYMRTGAVPGDESIYRGVKQVPPGAIVTFDAAGSRTRSYWSTRAKRLAAAERPFSGSYEDALRAVEIELDRAIRERMIADVPLGAFLSGGIDSSLVVALMQRHAGRPVATFTVGYEEPRYDESRSAAEIAALLGTRHTTLQVSSADTIAIVEELPAIYDEPFADSSQIPAVLLARLARRFVTVAMSGDGGDEVFLGYTRHSWGRRLWPLIRHIPPVLRHRLGRFLSRLSPRAVELLSTGLSCVGMSGSRLVPEHMHKLVAGLSAGTEFAFYRALSEHGDESLDLVLGAPDGDISPELGPSGLEFVEKIALWDIEGYLREDILVKVDRATMAASLEARCPLLDHRLVELAWTLPTDYKLKGGRRKALLRDLLSRFIPEKLINRPKAGFAVPIDAWLRGPLRPWADDLLSEDRLRRQGVLRVPAVQGLWQDHLSGRRDNQHELWMLLVLQAWLG